MTFSKSTANDHKLFGGLFDAAWYERTYADVRKSGLTPEYHYRHYGLPIMRRPPSATFASEPQATREALFLPAPPPGEELAAADLLMSKGDHALALAYARLHMPADRAASVEIIRANAELAAGNTEQWLLRLNAYFSWVKTDAVALLDTEAPILERLFVPGVIPVEGGPLVSVIMPAWNAARTIEMAVKSILGQTWQNLELIVIDDASSDDTWACLTRLAALDSRLRIRRNSRNVGPYVSKNLGLDMVRGEWVTGHDADDWAHARRIERHIGYVLNQPTPPRASLTFMLRMTPTGIFDAITGVSDFSPDGAMRVSSISTLFSRQFLVKHLGYWDTVRFGADTEMISRTRMLLGSEFREIQQIGMLCLSLDGGLTNHPEFGIRADNGRASADRLAYKTAYQNAHAIAGKGPYDLYIPFPQKVRRYKGSFKHAVTPEDIEEVIHNSAGTTDGSAVDETSAPRAAAPTIQAQLSDPKLAELLASKTPAELDLIYTQKRYVDTRSARHPELVSVIMPSFNNAAWLPRAVNAVLSQQQVRVELIVIDDGSTDNSVAIAQEIAHQVDNMRVISLLRNFGCYYARNIGVMEARGDYVTLLDSDDIMTPDRLVLQLDAIKSKPGIVASQSRLRRWSVDYKVPLSDLKYAENSLMWRRDIIEEIGAYDSVRFGGDTEFRMRIQARYGVEAILRFPTEQYFLRTVENSLTAKGGSQAYTIDKGKLSLQLSPERSDYVSHFSEWHATATPLRIQFPQTTRPFSLGSPSQNASPSLGHRRVGSMASYPPRRESLQVALSSILPQLDTLILYLNDYHDVPDFAVHPKIRIVRSQEAKGNLRDNGKFFDLPDDNYSYVFTFDDDLIYPQDYTARMIHQIEVLKRSSVIGLHAVTFPEKERFTSHKQRKMSHFLHAKKGHFADLLGTGTTAWHSSTLKPTLDDFGTMGVCDLWFAALAARRNVPMFSMPRKADWLKLYKIFDENLYHEALGNPALYFDIYHREVAPAQRGGAVRINKTREMAEQYSPVQLEAAGIDLLQ
jgi:glycosyltransferase involved in cell wall biosynthesis